MSKAHHHIGPDTFGLSAPRNDVEAHFGLGVKQLVNKFRRLFETN